ncbi:NfeD family protein [Candidatus Paracaedibacter symbiosus]|uniref:NfeD family protein n=1 Tax=Candidatus Paracaedibacter symbiosus TaxID=244582 RepID=UPI000509C302|nr:NfeD family protein [Candidatus Paracaedibacter symbiosus]
MDLTVWMPLEFWHWLILGLAFLGVELLTLGAYFLWIGVAALMTGGLVYLLPLTPIGQVILFAALAILLIGGSRKFLTRSHEKSAQTGLNQRGAQLIGRELVLEEPIFQGKAQVSIGDSKWIVHGPDLAAGEKITVIRVEGVILIVTPLEK